MRWYDYLFVVAVSMFFSAVAYQLGLYQSKVKVIDLVAVINSETEKLLKEENLSPKEKEERLKEFFLSLQNSLEREKGIVLIKQAVIGGTNYEDITNRYLREEK